MRFLQHPETLADPATNLELATKQYVDNTTADAGHGHAENASLVASLRAHLNLSGGGNISLTGANELSWSQRFIIIANGNGSHFSTAGHFSLNMPASGAVIRGIGATADVTVTTGGIPLGTWQALYAVLTIGGGSASYEYAITDYNVAHSLPSNYVLLAVRNNDNGRVHLSTGMELAPNETRSEADTIWTSRNFDPASKSNTTHTHDTTHNHDADYVNEVDHTKAAHDALNIDADTVDGQHASAFAPAGHTHATRFSALIGDGTGVSFTVAHNLGTKSIIAQTHEVGDEAALIPGSVSDAEIRIEDVNTISIHFAVAPAASSIRVVVLS